MAEVNINSTLITLSEPLMGNNKMVFVDSTQEFNTITPSDHAVAYLCYGELTTFYETVHVTAATSGKLEVIRDKGGLMRNWPAGTQLISSGTADVMAGGTGTFPKSPFFNHTPEPWSSDFAGEATTWSSVSTRMTKIESDIVELSSAYVSVFTWEYFGKTAYGVDMPFIRFNDDGVKPIVFMPMGAFQYRDAHWWDSIKWMIKAIADEHNSVATLIKDSLAFHICPAWGGDNFVDKPGVTEFWNTNSLFLEYQFPYLWEERFAKTARGSAPLVDSAVDAVVSWVNTQRTDDYVAFIQNQTNNWNIQVNDRHDNDHYYGRITQHIKTAAHHYANALWEVQSQTYYDIGFYSINYDSWFENIAPKQPSLMAWFSRVNNNAKLLSDLQIGWRESIELGNTILLDGIQGHLKAVIDLITFTHSNDTITPKICNPAITLVNSNPSLSSITSNKPDGYYMITDGGSWHISGGVTKWYTGSKITPPLTLRNSGEAKAFGYDAGSYYYFFGGGFTTGFVSPYGATGWTFHNAIQRFELATGSFSLVGSLSENIIAPAVGASNSYWFLHGGRRTNQVSYAKTVQYNIDDFSVSSILSTVNDSHGYIGGRIHWDNAKQKAWHFNGWYCLSHATYTGWRGLKTFASVMNYDTGGYSFSSDNTYNTNQCNLRGNIKGELWHVDSDGSLYYGGGVSAGYNRGDYFGYRVKSYNMNSGTVSSGTYFRLAGGNELTGGSLCVANERLFVINGFDERSDGENVPYPYSNVRYVAASEYLYAFQTETIYPHVYPQGGDYSPSWTWQKQMIGEPIGELSSNRGFNKQGPLIWGQTAIPYEANNRIWLVGGERFNNINYRDERDQLYGYGATGGDSMSTFNCGSDYYQNINNNIYAYDYIHGLWGVMGGHHYHGNDITTDPVSADTGDALYLGIELKTSTVRTDSECATFELGWCRVETATLSMASNIAGEGFRSTGPIVAPYSETMFYFFQYVCTSGGFHRPYITLQGLEKEFEISGIYVTKNEQLTFLSNGSPTLNTAVASIDVTFTDPTTISGVFVPSFVNYSKRIPANSNKVINFSDLNDSQYDFYIAAVTSSGQTAPANQGVDTAENLDTGIVGHVKWYVQYKADYLHTTRSESRFIGETLEPNRQSHHNYFRNDLIEFHISKYTDSGTLFIELNHFGKTIATSFHPTSDGGYKWNIEGSDCPFWVQSDYTESQALEVSTPATVNKFYIGAESESAIEIEPFEVEQGKRRDDHRNIAKDGGMYRYWDGSSDTLVHFGKITTTYNSSSTAAIIDSWWQAGIQTGAGWLGQPAFKSGPIVNNLSPIAGRVKPHDDLFFGIIKLESF